MKKIVVLTVLVLAVSLIAVNAQVLASPAIAAPKKTPGPGGPPATFDPGKPSSPGNSGQGGGLGPQKTPGAQATAHAGDMHGKPTMVRGTISAVDASSLTLTLADGSSVTIGLTSDTRIKVPGPQAQGDTLLAGMQVMVMAFSDSNDQLVARAVMVIPGKPVSAHRVGTVTAYTAGSSITIQAMDGNSYTFGLTANTKILPANGAGPLAVGSRVTIIAPRDPSAVGWTATGIVIHPAKP